MYLTRLHRYNGVLNNVVTFLDEYGRAEAKRADAEIRAGHYKGPLHGIPWGAKDIISVKGFKTTWGSPAFKDQSFDYDASVVEMLREAGAGRRKIRGTPLRDRAGRQPVRPRQRRQAASRSASAPRRAARF